MANFTTIRISTTLIDDARREAPVFSRSLSGQVEHWARLGQAIEAAPGFTLDRVRAALEGQFSPTDLSDDEQEIYYDLLADRRNARMEKRRAAFAQELLQQPGNVGYDKDGNLVQTLGDGKVEILEPAE